MSEQATAGPLSGRRAEAARNDERILDAAREVFLADPEAPISTVATRAAVGISALYRRYPSKTHLLRALAADGLTRFIADLEDALASDAEPWAAYVECLNRVVEGRSQALAQRLAGTFTPTQELTELARRRFADRLAVVDGVAQVLVLGERKPSISAPARRRVSRARSKSARSTSSVCVNGEPCAYEWWPISCPSSRIDSTVRG